MDFVKLVGKVSCAFVTSALAAPLGKLPVRGCVRSTSSSIIIGNCVSKVHIFHLENIGGGGLPIHDVW
jgi:hypothetical protein